MCGGLDHSVELMRRVVMCGGLDHSVELMR